MMFTVGILVWSTKGWSLERGYGGPDRAGSTSGNVATELQAQLHAHLETLFFHESFIAVQMMLAKPRYFVSSSVKYPYAGYAPYAHPYVWFDVTSSAKIRAVQ